MSDHNRQPRLESPYFGDKDSMYGRMARVLDYTARRLCPGWAVNVRQAEPELPQGPQRDTLLHVNAQKMDLWCRTIVEAPLGDRICLMDSDTFLVNGLDGVWDQNFDIALTVRDFIIPINTGVVFVRVTPETKAFFQRWLDVNAAMYVDVPFHMQWKPKYGGMTQSSLGYILESGDHGLNVLTLPCLEWNCEDSCWGAFDPAVTRVLHVKSVLRRLVFQGDVSPPEYPWWTNEDLAPLAERWYALEREAVRAEEKLAA
jgi:hypothetical protein